MFLDAMLPSLKDPEKIVEFTRWLKLTYIEMKNSEGVFLLRTFDNRFALCLGFEVLGICETESEAKGLLIDVSAGLNL